MKLQMHAIHFNADQKLLDFIQSKLNKLETFFDRIIDGEVYLRLEQDDTKENKIIEIKLNAPGNQFFAKNKAKSFEAAVDNSVEALRRQIKKHKEKQLTF